MEAGVRPERNSGGGANDALLLGRVGSKDVQAFEELYRRYRTRLTRFLIKLIHRPTLVEDVLNETFIVIWDRAHTFNGASKVSTWIFAIAYRKAMKALRGNDEPVEDRWSEQQVSLEPTPEDAFGRQRARSLLLDAIGELSPEHRAVVEFTYFHEMGYREIAQIMGCPVDTVKTRMFHARRHLKRRLSGEFPDWI